VKEERMTKEIQDMTFEEAFTELEDVVNRLEKGGLALEDSLTFFERGQALAAYCSELLDNAELKVKQITPEGESTFYYSDR
jgi:exodeoxyribonuclease VII small subunit